MRVVAQRVLSAEVRANDEIIAQIGSGLLVLAGFGAADAEPRIWTDIEWLCAKLVNLRIFRDENDLMNRSIFDAGGDILAVSQFTLYAATRKGNRPSFVSAAPAQAGKKFYEAFTAQLGKALGKPVKTGIFGAYMQVSLVNDGPVTIMMDTQARE